MSALDISTQARELPLGYFKLPEVLDLYKVSRSTFYAGMQAGIFPRPVKLTGRRAVGWRREDNYALIARTSAESAETAGAQ